MIIKYDKNQAQSQFVTVAEGTYEVLIDVAVVGKASTGTPALKMRHKIRKDVDQPHGGQLIFDDIYYTEASEWQLHNLLGSVNTPEDHAGFNDLQEIADYVVGKAMRVTVKHRDYKGKTQVDVKAREASQVGGGRVDDPFASTSAPAADPFANAGQATQQSTYTPPQPTYNGKPATQMQDEQDPFANSKAPIEIDEDDLPF